MSACLSICLLNHMMIPNLITTASWYSNYLCDVNIGTLHRYHRFLLSLLLRTRQQLLVWIFSNSWNQGGTKLYSIEKVRLLISCWSDCFKLLSRPQRSRPVQALCCVGVVCFLLKKMMGPHLSRLSCHTASSSFKWSSGTWVLAWLNLIRSWRLGSWNGSDLF